MGCVPASLMAFGRAPYSSNARTPSRSPFNAASASGVVPAVPAAFGSAPIASNIFVTPVWWCIAVYSSDHGIGPAGPGGFSWPEFQSKRTMALRSCSSATFAESESSIKSSRAASNAVRPRRSRAVRSAPASSSRPTQAGCPESIATCSGVIPLSSNSFNGGCRESNCRMRSAWHTRAA